MVMIHTQYQRSLGSEIRVQTNGRTVERTDKRTEPIAFCLANAMGKVHLQQRHAYGTEHDRLSNLRLITKELLVLR